MPQPEAFREGLLKSRKYNVRVDFPFKLRTHEEIARRTYILVVPDNVLLMFKKYFGNRKNQPFMIGAVH